MGMTEQQNVQTQEKQTLNAEVLSHCKEWKCMWNKVKKTITESGKNQKLHLRPFQIMTLFTMEHHHSCPHSSIHILPINHREWKNPLHFLPQHLVPGKGTATAQDPADPQLLQVLHREHGAQVLHEATAQGSGDMAQGQLRGTNAAHWCQQLRKVSLSKDGWVDWELAVFLGQGCLDYPWVDGRFLNLKSCRWEISCYQSERVWCISDVDSYNRHWCTSSAKYWISFSVPQR